MYNRREFLQTIGAGAAGVLAGSVLTIPGRAGAARPPGLPPNIIVLMSDDQGYFDTSLHGSKFIPMPNLEALAAGGVRFTNGYTSGAVCSPTRAGFHTGRYQQRFNMNSNNPGATALLNSGERLVACYLRQAGYASKLVGKWHLGDTSHPMDEYGPTGAKVQAYDEYFGFQRAWVDQTQYWMHPLFHVNRQECTSVAQIESELGYSLEEDAGFLCDAETRVAIDFINRKKDQPFFLYMAYGTPHTTIKTTEKWLDRLPETFTTDHPASNSDKRHYAGMLLSLDDSIGRIMQCLRDNNIEQDTIIFYLSDNGGAAATNLQTGILYSYDNFPLEGHKADAWDGGYHVPFAIRWPGHITPGVKTTPVISLDMGATALGAAGISALPSLPQDGLNLLPWLTGQQGSLSQRYLFWNHSGSVARDWTKYKYRDGAVYDLETDIEEKTPLTSGYSDPDTGESYASILSRLSSAYGAWAGSL